MFLSEYFLCLFGAFLGVMLSVGYFSLVERKLLAYSQLRKGPNKVGLVGLAQPVADAMKLMMKESVVPSRANKVAFMLAPILSFAFSMGLWVLTPLGVVMGLSSYWGVLYFFCLSGCSVYGVILAGWASNSKYAMFGAVRALAQVISYEVAMVMVCLVPGFIKGSFEVMELAGEGFVPLGLAVFPLFLSWLIILFAETHRAPFDFVEGESELVSGYNVEYGGVGFMLLFLAEYSSILFMSYWTVIMWWGMGASSETIGLVKEYYELDQGGCCRYLSFWAFELWVKTTMVACFIVLVRASFPRYRYDLLMMFMWKRLLPVVMGWMILLLSLQLVRYYPGMVDWYWGLCGGLFYSLLEMWVAGVDGFYSMGVFVPLE